MFIPWQNYAVHDDKQIRGFFGNYRWLSNFHLCPIHFDGLEYTSSENAYQAMKVQDKFKHHFALGGIYESPEKAKKMGKSFPLDTTVDTWDKIKTCIMRDILDAKFLQNHDLAIKLVETGNRYLEETNSWKDNFWGVDYKIGGENNLGKILMSIRKYWTPVLS